jgi:chromosome segregation ATPase
MQAKSTRGVQQDDVWAAADALIAEGLRPTIERVRQKIGRGSPNTVSPMLESWFATLGPRLGVDGPKVAADNVPIEVRNAALKMWEASKVFARQEGALALEEAQKTLTEALVAVETREDEVSRRAQLFEQRESATNDALQVARNQIIEAAARLEESQLQLGRRETEIGDLRSALEDLGKQRDADRRQSDEALRRYSDERSRQEERAIANEKRLMEELDRERQGNKQARIAISEAERRMESNRQSAEAINAELSKRLLETELELRSLRQSLASENERTSELRTLLDQQRTATGTALDQLNQFLANSARVAAIVPAKRNRTKANGDHKNRTDAP